MAKRVGATEAERWQIIGRLRSGMQFEDAAGPFRAIVEDAWFDANQKELLEQAKDKAASPPSVAATVPHEIPRQILDERKAPVVKK